MICIMINNTVKPVMREHPTGPHNVVLYGRWSFITGTNVWKCRAMLLQKWSLIRGRSLITVVCDRRFDYIHMPILCL